MAVGEASNYGVGFATAESPFGPFKKSANNPVLSQEPDGEYPIYSVGHGSIVASPPKRNWEDVGAQDVTLETPKGAELFYVHHGRNSTEIGRTIYTTRMEIHEGAIYFGSDDAISMSLTAMDQPLPKDTYPLKLEAKCSDKGGEKVYSVRVTSKTGAAFDLSEGTNRIVGKPGNVQPELMTAEKDDGSYTASFGEHKLKEVVYQRLSVDGSWKDVTARKVHCH